MVRLSKRYRTLLRWNLLFVLMLSLQIFLSQAVFAQSTPEHAFADASGHRGKLFLFIQGVDTHLSADHARKGIISAQETFGLPNGPYPFLKATYPKASFLVFSYNGDNGKGIPTAYGCQDTLADKGQKYVLSNTLKTYATRLNTQLRHYLTRKPATDVYLVAHSLGGIVASSYLAYLKSFDNLDTSIAGTRSKIKGIITLDSPIGGVAGGLAYAEQILDAFAHAGYPCPALKKQHIILSTAILVNAIYQDAHSPLGGTGSVMNVMFGNMIANQSLAEQAARHGAQVLTIGNERDFLFGPRACNPSLTDFLSSQWIADRGNTSGVYGRTFTSGAVTCTSLDVNHQDVLTNNQVHQAIRQLVDEKPVTSLQPSR